MAYIKGARISIARNNWNQNKFRNFMWVFNYLEKQFSIGIFYSLFTVPLLVTGSVTNAIAQECSGTASTPVTITDETQSGIPNSRQIVNGSATTIDTSTPGQVKVNVNLPNSGVTAGTYTNASIGVNAQGIVTSASNGSGGGGSANAQTAGGTAATVPNVIVPANGLLQPLPFDRTLRPAASGLEYTVPTGSSTALGNCAGPDGNVWFTESAQNKIAKLTPTGTFTEYTVPTGSSTPTGICAGPDGNLWFTEQAGNKIAKCTTGGSMTEYTVPTGSSAPLGICAGPDGNLWFTESSGNKIGVVTVSGTFTEYAVPTSSSQPRGICAGPDGNLWFTETNGNKIGKITPTGTITEYTVTTGSSSPYYICSGPDGNLWFTEAAANNVGKITTSGTMIEYSVPTASSTPYGICAGPDGNLWVCENATDRIASVTTNGTITEYTLPSSGAGASFICIGPDGNLWLTEQSTNKVASWRFTASGTTPVLNSITAGNFITVSRSATGINLSSGINTQTRRQWFPAQTNGLINSVGFSNTALTSGTYVAQTGTDGNVYSLSTASTSASANAETSQKAPTNADIANYACQPVFTTVMSLNRTTNCRVWAGLIPNAVTVGNTDTPSPDILAFRYSTNASDTHWMTYTSTHAGVNTVVDTGVSITASQPDVLTIDASNLSSVKFYINGNLVDTRTTNLPGSSFACQPHIHLTTLTASVLSGYLGVMTLTHF
jgi:virginiamycin B lyase